MWHTIAFISFEFNLTFFHFLDAYFYIFGREEKTLTHYLSSASKNGFRMFDFVRTEFWM